MGDRIRKERRLAGSRRPSFLKRQKEQKRLARAQEKRESRQARKRAQLEQAESAEQVTPEELLDAAVPAETELPEPTDETPKIN